MTLSANERRILDLIWRRGPIARSEIARAVDLTTGSVTRITQTLLRHGLLLEGSQHNGGRGTPSKPLSINPKGALAYGVSFSHRYMDVGLIDLSGRLLHSIRRYYDQAHPDVVRANAEAAIAEIEATIEIDRSRVVGIGFAVPGDFGPVAPFIVAHPYFPHLRNVDLVATFGHNMPYPVFIENDCNSAALGERLVGHGRRFGSFLYVFVCHGIGGGVIIDGALYRGTNGNAGGLHAFFPIGQSRPSGHDLFDLLSRESVAVRDFSDLEVDQAIELPGIRPWLFRAGKQLRDALSITARLFDPEAIVIGGRLPADFLTELVTQIDDTTFCASSISKAPLVVPSELGARAVVVGAAAVVLYARYFDPA